MSTTTVPGQAHGERPADLIAASFGWPLADDVVDEFARLLVAQRFSTLHGTSTFADYCQTTLGITLDEIRTALGRDESICLESDIKDVLTWCLAYPEKLLAFINRLDFNNNADDPVRVLVQKLATDGYITLEPLVIVD